MPLGAVVIVWLTTGVDIFYGVLALVITIDPGPRQPTTGRALVRNAVVAAVIVALGAFLFETLEIGIDSTQRLFQGGAGIAAGVTIIGCSMLIRRGKAD